MSIDTNRLCQVLILVTYYRKTKLITIFRLNRLRRSLRKSGPRFDNHCSSNIMYTAIENFTDRRDLYCTVSSNFSVRWTDTDIVLLQLTLPSVDVCDR